MRLSASIYFLTLVLIGAAVHAAPVTDNRPSAISISPKAPGEPIYSDYEHIERNWSLRLGFLGGALSETKKSGQVYFYGLRRDFLQTTYSSWQVEVTTAVDNFMHLVIGKKFYFPLEDVTLPYYKFSAGQLISSTEGLGAIFNLKKTQAMAAIGLEDLFQWNKHLQAEIGVSYALVGPQLEFSFGWAF